VLLAADGTTVAEGSHGGAGTAHAEAAALSQAGELARGTTAVVTLEPCAHQGRTGPCADALITAGVRRVIFAQRDPNPVATGGAERLRAAGVEVISGHRSDEAVRLNPDWTFAQLNGRPRVRLKIASTLDGRVAASDGSSRWITSAAAREDGHRLRADADAVVVGTGTVLADDPLLTVRVPGSGGREQPLRAVFGTTPIPATAAIHCTDRTTEPPIMLGTRSPVTALSRLWADGVSSVLIEGGPRTAAAFLSHGLVDEVISYFAPALLGAGPPAVGDLGVSTISDALRGEITDVRSLGNGSQLCVRIITRLITKEQDHVHRHH